MGPVHVGDAFEILTELVADGGVIVLSGAGLSPNRASPTTAGRPAGPGGPSR